MNHKVVTTKENLALCDLMSSLVDSEFDVDLDCSSFEMGEKGFLGISLQENARSNFCGRDVI